MMRTLRLLLAIGKQVGEINMALIAAGVAFYSMLALFPGIAAMISLWGLVSDPSVVVDELQLMQGIIPEQVYALVSDQVVKISSGSGSALGWTGIVSLSVAIWSARSGVASLMLGLNQIHGDPNRGSLKHYLTALLLTVALLGVGIVALGSVVIVPLVLKLVPLGMISSILIELVRWLAAVLALLMGLSLIYRYGPNSRGKRLKWATPGAGLAVTGWAIASFGFSLYLTNFANYNETYGSLGAAVAMLFWLYITAFLVLLGASLNVQLARRRIREGHAIPGDRTMVEGPPEERQTA
ncbi:YihY/virulence factor BrkB family protein [Pseudooceanicola sp. CBS1P-1]|uniref:YihY family inner membrane protein n=1 Tax=Pseudooceanicola albus TaxID=2692189 RepID=A0A6L7G8A5_9RHOB|nr:MULTISPECIES: YihY/virulence factor BrkB family protein [Pseudooceanicola]MBT9386368.1 YihY/virulence factor BrkB family protein [Pseudooceanicola endophyticus]MXN20474.1 YihY family inner membrane protein [Pseudooceanicola albus]